MRRTAAGVALAALLLAPAAHADEALERVRAALRALAGTAPVRATLERAVTSERKGRPLEAGRATLKVTSRADGVSIGYDAGLLAQVRSERADPDPEKAEPARRTLENFDATDVADLLHGAPALLADLDGATLKAASDGEHDGRPARVLDLELKVRVSKADAKWLKSASRSMKLWTTPDGLPLAEETASAYTVGLLFFTFDATEVRTQRFAHVADRLVTVRRISRFDGEGLGESQHFASDTTLRLEH